MNKLKFLFILMLLFLVGCSIAEPEKQEENLEAYIVWVESNVPNKIIGTYELPVTNPELGGQIIWISLSPSIINDNGTALLRDDSAEATLEYTIIYNGEMYVGTKTIRVIRYTHEEVAEKFADQFSSIITRDYEVKVNFGEDYIVTWNSSNKEVFTNEGKYIKPAEDTKFIIAYSVEFDGKKYDYTIELKAKGSTLADKEAEIKQWITANYIKERLVSSELTLPIKYAKYNVDLIWESSNTGVISTSGKVTRYPFDRYVTLVLYFYLDGVKSEVEFSLVVAAKTVSTKDEKIESFLNAIAVPEISQLTFSSYAGMNQSFNYLPLYTNEQAIIYNQKLMPIGGSRPGTKLYSVEFITIHDTANNNTGAGGQTHQNLLYNGYDSASWHFATDATGNYQSIPTDEVAWHAGDGSMQFKLTDTGVKATTKYPVITISTDGYYEFNGVKSKIAAPLVAGRIAKTSDITPSGLYSEIGANGNYYLNSTYYSTSFAKISTGGGNRNSIGFETCVNQGNDYAQTLRHTAKLVAELLIEHNLSVDRVLQHNNFSGKNCPNAMRNIGYWNNFLDLVSLEKYAKTELSDVQFIWNSGSSLMSNTGKISLSAKAGNVLNYSVTATYNAKVIEKSFSTKLA